MKERKTVDAVGNVRIQQWADNDPTYPAEFANEDDLNDRLDHALDNLRAYRDTPTPSNVQTVAVVKLLCRVVIALVRLYRRSLDGVD